MPSGNLSAQIIRQEIDLSQIPASTPGVYAGIVISSPKGPTEATIVTSETEFVELYGKPSKIAYYSGYSAITYFRRGGSKLIVKRVTKNASYAALAVKATGQAEVAVALDKELTNPDLIVFSDGAAGGAPAPSGAISLSKDTLFVLYARDPGVFGNKLSVYITPVKNLAGTDTDKFTITVYNNCEESCNSRVAVEEWTVSRKHRKNADGASEYIEDVLSKSSYIRCVNNILAEEDVLPGDWSTKTTNPPGIELSGAKAGDVPGKTEYVNGLKDFYNKDILPLRLTLNGGLPWEDFIKAQIELAEARKDHIALCVDSCQFAITSTYMNALVNWRKLTLAVDTSWAALYSDDVDFFDNYDGKNLFIPIDGYVGGIISKNFYEREIWYAPAGWNYGKINTSKLKRNFNLSERDVLYQNNINTMKFKPGTGCAVWGQKTLQFFPSATDRINVRLALIEVQESTENLLENFEFEFNDSFTRSRVKAVLSSMMESFKARRAFYAYEVLCDETNNTPMVIDSNMMYVDLFVQPTKVAEVIVFRTIITRTGVDFSEYRQGV